MGVYDYEIIRGLFVFHPENGQAPGEIKAVPDRFGLIDDESDHWKTFFSKLETSNKESDEKTSFKLIIFGRHGQGWHNVGELKYGTEVWDAKWAKLNGDDEIIWAPDPELTPLGKEQARDVNKIWTEEVKAGISIPDRLYCSPMTRAIQTHQITFEAILPSDRKTVIIENCREQYVDHPCDKRRTRSYIASTFPDYIIEDGLTEEDVLYKGTLEEGETEEDLVRRAKGVLDRIFAEDARDSFISVTAHSGLIRGFLTALGSERYTLPTGGIISVVVKGTLRE